MPVSTTSNAPDHIPCPCHCGRDIGPRRLGPAAQYPGLANLLDAATPALDWIRDTEIDDTDWARTQRSTERFRRNCNQVLRHHLDHLHGTATAGRTPDIPSMLRLTEAAAGGLLEAVALSELMGGPGLRPPVPDIGLGRVDPLAG